MAYMSLRDKKISYLQKQQSELKKTLLGKKNGCATNEIPLMRKTMAMNRKQERKTMAMEGKMVKETLHQKKVNLMREKQLKMKYPPSKVSLKSFY